VPDAKQKVVINIAGGWATDFGPAFTGAPQGNALTIPFLPRADNVFYELDGGFHKVGGTAKFSAAQITESAAAVTIGGLYDYWTQGTSGVEGQSVVLYAGTKYLSMDPTTGVTTVRKTGLESGKRPCFEVFKDQIILTTTSTVDAPQTWDQSAGSTSALGGSPPKFSVLAKHKNRLFAAGVATNGSRLYYCATLDATTWSGLDAGSIDIDPDDGDRITGLASHKNELLVFKGPNHLSIHRITGSAPTGTDAFARVPYVSGLGSLNHQGIFRVNDDLVFSSPRGLHSLAATAAYGNYIEAFLSRPILSYYQDSLSHANGGLNMNWGVNYQSRGLAIWTVPSSGTTLDTYLVYDYRFQPGRWSRWTGYSNANCLAVVQDTNRRHRLYSGATDGWIRVLDQTSRSIDGTGAYAANVTFPFLNFGTSSVLKTAEDLFVSLVPKGSYDAGVAYTRDSSAEQTVSPAVSQAGSDPLG